MANLHFHNERLSELLHREIQLTISQKLRDPRIPPVVTVTHVKLAPDNRNATVFVSIFGEENIKKEALSALNNAAPFVQKVVAANVVVKHFPKLYFKIDNSIEHGQRINELLKDIQDDLEQSE